MKLFSTALVTATMIALVGCSSPFKDHTDYSADTYKGDGTMVDRGPESSHDRFILDLGSLDLSKPSKVSYKMSNLPPVKLNVGMRMIDFPAAASAYDTAIGYNKAQVSVLVQTDSGTTVAQSDRPLSRWGWSPNRDSANKLYYNARDYTYNSSFTPKKGDSYILTIEIVPDPTSSGTLPTTLQVAGGGWKI